ncbi:MAG: hypothetical protein JWN64_547 [Parcubacteria group bacterium]|nr:hypothetical protein [Parcubacteria group bacterium]
MKSHLYAFLILSAFALPAVAFAQENGFKSLTNAPFLQGAGNVDTMPAFLNNLYKVLIGIAATLAVLQIMRAGVTWMTAGDNSEKITQARGLIRDSLIGLLLILSPVIVFSIINPDILKLKIGGIDQLQLPQNTPTDTTTSPAGASAATACVDYAKVAQLKNNTCSSLPGEGWGKVSDSCCAPAPKGQSGWICCGVNKTTPATVKQDTPAAPAATATSYNYGIMYKSYEVGDRSQEACVMISTGTLPTQAACDSEYNGKKAKVSNIQYSSRACSPVGSPAANTPADSYATLSKLPVCANPALKI